jgi:hypothetical protein
MVDDADVTFNAKEWNAIVKHVIETQAVPAMQVVADASNATLSGDQGYFVSTEGDDPLTKRDYRAPVITATGDAMRDNAKNNTLVKNFYLAGAEIG